jgi:hypothetical protein
MITIWARLKIWREKKNTDGHTISQIYAFEMYIRLVENIY